MLQLVSQRTLYSIIGQNIAIKHNFIKNHVMDSLMKSQFQLVEWKSSGGSLDEWRSLSEKELWRGDSMGEVRPTRKGRC